MNADDARWNGQAANMPFFHDVTCEKLNRPDADNCNLCGAIVRTGVAYDCIDCGDDAKFMCFACRTNHDIRHNIVEHNCFLRTHIVNQLTVIVNNLRHTTLCLLAITTHRVMNDIWMKVADILSDFSDRLEVAFEQKLQTRDPTMVLIVHKSDKLVETSNMLHEIFRFDQEDLPWAVTACLVNLENEFRSIDENAFGFVGNDNPTLMADWFQQFRFRDMELNEWLHDARRRPYLARQELRDIRRHVEMARAQQQFQEQPRQPIQPAPQHQVQQVGLQVEERLRQQMAAIMRLEQEQLGNQRAELLAAPQHPLQQAGLQMAERAGQQVEALMRIRQEIIRNHRAAQPAAPRDPQQPVAPRDLQQPAAPRDPPQPAAQNHVQQAGLQMAAQMRHQLAVQPAAQVIQQHVAQLGLQNEAQRRNQVAPQPAAPHHPQQPAPQNHVQRGGLPMAVQMGLRQAEQLGLQIAAEMVQELGVHRGEQVAAHPAAPHRLQQPGQQMIMNQVEAQQLEARRFLDNPLRQQQMQDARFQQAARPYGNPMQLEQIVGQQRQPMAPMAQGHQQEFEHPRLHNLSSDEILGFVEFLLQLILDQQRFQRARGEHANQLETFYLGRMLHNAVNWVRHILLRREEVGMDHVRAFQQQVQQIDQLPNDPEFANRLNELIGMGNVMGRLLARDEFPEEGDRQDEQMREQQVQEMQWNEQEDDEEEEELEQLDEEQLEAHPEQDQIQPHEPQNDQVLVENDVEEAPNRPEVENQPVAGQNQQIPSGQVVSRNDDAAVQARQLSADSNEGTSRSAANSTNGADTSDDEAPRSSHSPMENEEREVVTKNGRHHRQAPSEDARTAQRRRGRRGRAVNSETASSNQGASSSKRPREESGN